MNPETININIAAEPGYYSKLPRWRLSHSHECVQTCADRQPGTEHAQTKLPLERKQENEPWSFRELNKFGHELGRG